MIGAKDWHMRTPLRLRKLKAEMVLRGLDLGTLSKRSGISYTFVSELLTGSRVDEKRLLKLSAIIMHTKMPEEAHA